MSLGSIHYLAYLSLLIATVPALLASPVINEFMFHAPGNPADDTREEWIELYNTSKTSINVSGWRFTKGIDFAIPEGTQLPANGFLIVAADTATFHTAHPDINTDVIGNWSGRLSNDSETITLTNANGNPVDQLDYATQGDWGLRTQSAPEKEITGWIWENKADGDGHSLEKRQPLVRLSSGMAWAPSTEAGGTPGATNSTFTENLAPVIQDVEHEPIIPKSSDTITITAQVTDDADPSPEVSLFYRIDGDQPWQRQAMLDNNSTHKTTIGPFSNKAIIEYYIEAQDAEEPKHSWPRRSKKPGGGINIFDVDELEQFNNALVQVDDAYHLNSWEPGSPPRYRIIMTAEQRDLLKKAQDLSSRSVPINVAFHATFVSEDGTGVKARHNVAVRDRGFSSRSGTPVNYHVAFPSGDRWNESKSIQLNSRFPFSQALGAAMFQLAGLSTTEAVPVDVFVNGVSTADTGAIGYSRYVRAEPVNGDWMKRLLPNDPNGNLYRIDDHAAIGTGQFDYAGEDAAPYDVTYLKKTNEALHDYSDIVRLTKVLNQAAPKTFRQEVDQVVNVRQWLRYLATNALIANQEGGLATGRADDFAIYSGVEDPRFILLPHDLDTVMSIGERDFNSTRLDIFVYRRLRGMQKLLSDDTQTIREYYQVYLEMLDDWFNSETIDPVIDQIFEGWVPNDKITKAKSFVVERSDYVLSQIPQENVTIPRPETLERINGRIQSTTGNISFEGRFHVGDVGSIMIGGVEASLSYGERTNLLTSGQWSWDSAASILSPGVNVLAVQYYSEPGGQGEIVHTNTFEVFYRQPVTQVSADSYGDADADNVIHWTKDESPFHLVSDVTIPARTQLRIEPGVQVYLESKVRLTVEGTLQVLGEPNQRVRFGPHPQADDEDDPLLPGQQFGAPKWGGIRLTDSLSPENKILYTDFINAQPTDNKGSIGIIRSECFIDHCTFSGTHYRMVYGRNCSLTVQYCTFPDMFAEDENPVAIGLDNVAEQLKVESANFPEVQGDPRFVGGFPVGGHFRVYHNDFYGNKGHNDVFDADSGRWGVSPVLDCRYNHFHGPVGDEHMDLGGDAYVAFNIFENVNKDEFTSDRGYANAISTGDRGSGTTVVVVGNVFRNVEHAINCKVNTATIFEHNTCLDFFSDYDYRSGNIQQDIQASAVNLFVPEDFGPTPGDGAYLGYNVFHGSQDTPGLFIPGKGFPRLISWADQDVPARPPKTSRIQFYHNLIDSALEDESIGERHPGSVFDPQWGEGNVRGLPDTRLAPNDLPYGAEIPEWAYVTGITETSGTEVSLTIGGPGIFAYRWRLDNGPWSDPIAIAPGRFPRDTPTTRTAVLLLQELTLGQHRMEIRGQDFVGNWQPEETPTVLEWEVEDNSTNIVLNEIRASGGDALELFNRGEAVDLTGWSVSEDPTLMTNPSFPEGTMIETGGYFIVEDIQIDRDGDTLYLMDSNGSLHDLIEFDYQPKGYTLGRFGNEWQLCQDTLGEANEAVALGDVRELRIHEILAATSSGPLSDWLELHNPLMNPVALTGLHLTDNFAGVPAAYTFPAHSYLGPEGYLALEADGEDKEGHVPFSINADGEPLVLTSEGGEIIDRVFLSPQTEDHSVTWTTNGIASFAIIPSRGFDPAEEELSRMHSLLDHLRITEIHNESLPLKGEEFIELTNTGDTPLDLTGVSFTFGIEFTFPEMVLDSNSYVIVVREEAAIRARFPEADLPIAGVFDGKLGNNGEQITLMLPEPYHTAILDFSYEHRDPGYSLEIVDTEAMTWKWGDTLHGTPAGFTTGPTASLTGYLKWAVDFNQPSTTTDTDEDGVSALMEYALGTSPNRGEPLLLPRISPDRRFIVPVNRESTDLIYVIETSSDLQIWEPTATRGVRQAWPLSLDPQPSATNTTTVQLTLPDEATFVRLRVELP